MRKTRWWALLAVVLAAALLVPMLALAQRTGGSFGGSRWGSGSSSRSSSGGSWSRPSSGTSWSPRPSYGGSGGGSYGVSPIIPIVGVGSNAGGGGGVGLCCALLFLLVVVAVIVMVQRKNAGTAALQGQAPPFMPMGAARQDNFAEGVLAVAFDSRARAQIQQGIGQIAERSNMAADGLPRAAAETGQLLGQFAEAAYMTQHAIGEGLTMQAAQQNFDAAVNDARGRFLVETVRNDAGGVRHVQGPASRARAEEGGGFVVVTVVVGRRGGFFGFRPPTDRATLRQDLALLLQGDANLNAMEVVWQPSDPNDVMSSAEMAQVFPALRPIDPDANVQRRACGYCKTVFAAELRQCPNCGAPAGG